MSGELLPDSIRRLCAELAKLPGVGEKTALRYVMNLVAGDRLRWWTWRRVSKKSHSK